MVLAPLWSPRCGGGTGGAEMLLWVQGDGDSGESGTGGGCDEWAIH